MKRLALTTFSLFIFGFSAFAQNEHGPANTPLPVAASHKVTKRFSLDVNLGFGIPTQDYGNISDVPLPQGDTTHVNGLALSGFHFNATAGYLFLDFLGGMIMVGGNTNPFDETQWQSLRSAQVNGISTSVNGGFYIGEYFAGPYGSFALKNNLKLELKALFGLVTADYPTLDQKYPYYGTTVELVKTFKSANDFGYYLGGGIKYMATDNLGFSINAGYTASTIVYPQLTVNSTQTGSPTFTTQYSAHYMQLGIIQFTGGISLNL